MSPIVMQKVLVKDLKGPALDWAVATCEGFIPFSDGISWIIDKNSQYVQLPKYSSDWAQGGPIIERESISFRAYHNPEAPQHSIYYAKVCKTSDIMGRWANMDLKGDTPLIAAMRCFVANKFGAEIEVPETLI